MRKFNYLCSYILVITLALFIVTFGQNLAARTTSTYIFHFNENRVLNYVVTDLTGTEMADSIVDAMNSYNPEEFQIYEDTGYAIEGIFDEPDSQNMLKVKFALDISLIVCILTLIISVAIIVYFMRNEFKLALRKRMKTVAILTPLLLVAECFIFFSEKGNEILKNIVGFEQFMEDSVLKTLLGGDFISMYGAFTLLYCVIAFLAVAYLILFMTRPPRIFY